MIKKTHTKTSHTKKNTTKNTKKKSIGKGGSKPPPNTFKNNKKNKGIKSVDTIPYNGLCPTPICRMCSNRKKFPVEYFYCSKCYRLYQKHKKCPFKRFIKKRNYPKKIWIKNCCSKKKNVRKVGEVRKDNTCDFYPELVDYSYEKRDAIKMIPCRVHNCSCEDYNPVDPTLATKPLDGCSNCPHVKFLHTALNHKPEKQVKIKDDKKKH